MVAFNPEDFANKVVGAYLRQSVSDESKGSIEKQREQYETFCSTYQCQMMEPVIDRESGGNDRENLEELIDRIENEEIEMDYLFLWEESRLHRQGGMEGFIKYGRLYKAIPIVVDSGYGYPELIDLTEADKNTLLMYFLKMEEDHEEILRISYRVAHGSLNKAKRGELAPPVVYGYENVYEWHGNKRGAWKETKQTPEAKIVLEIFQKYDNGDSIISIVEDLNNRGEKTPSQVRGIKNAVAKWNPMSVANILDNEKYGGIFTFGKRSYGKYFRVTDKNVRKRGVKERDKEDKGKKKPKVKQNADYLERTEKKIKQIVPDALWNRVAAKRKQARSKPTSEKKKTYGNSKHTFARKITCAYCGAAFIGKQFKTHVKYFCSKYHKGTCSKPIRQVYESELLNIIAAALEELLKNRDIQKGLIKQSIEFYERMEKSLSGSNEESVRKELNIVQQDIARQNGVYERALQRNAPDVTLISIEKRIEELQETESKLEDSLGKESFERQKAIKMKESLKQSLKKWQKEMYSEVKETHPEDLAEIKSWPIEKQIVELEGNFSNFPTDEQSAYYFGMLNKYDLQTKSVAKLARELMKLNQNPIPLSNNEIPKDSGDLDHLEETFARIAASEIVESIILDFGKPYQYQQHQRVRLTNATIRFKTPVLDFITTFTPEVACNQC